MDKLRQYESSTVVTQPNQPLEIKNNKKYSARMHQPLLTVASVDARDKVQKKKMDDLLLSHVDTLTRSGSSKTLLP